MCRSCERGGNSMGCMWRAPAPVKKGYFYRDDNGKEIEVILDNVDIEYFGVHDAIKVSSAKELTYHERQKEIFAMMKKIDGSSVTSTKLYGKNIEEYTQLELYKELRKLGGINYEN